MYPLFKPLLSVTATRPPLGRFFAFTCLLLTAVAPVYAAPTYCNFECSSSSCRTTLCTDPESGSIITCQQWGSYDVGDWDCDGVGSGDNCSSSPNPDQADCDGDGRGDVCDSENAEYSLVAGSERLCWIDSWTRTLWGTYLDGYIEARFADTSSCGAPSKWEIVRIEPDYCRFVWNRLSCCINSRFTPSQCSSYLDAVIGPDLCTAPLN